MKVGWIFVIIMGLPCSFLLLDGYLLMLIQTSTATLPITLCDSISYFCSIDIKSIFMDWLNFYVHLPLAVILYRQPQISALLECVSANAVSILHALVALGGAKMISHDSLCIRRLGVMVFHVRNFLDALDGTMARARRKPGPESQSSVGFYLDGLCDGVGMIFLLIGCWSFLKTHPLKKASLYMPLPTALTPWIDQKEKDSGESTYSCLSKMTFSIRKKACRSAHLPLYLGFQWVACSFFWNRYISEFTNILEGPRSSEHLKSLQSSFLRQPFTLMTFFFWRWINVHAQFDWVLYAIFVDRLGEFLTLLHFLGWVLVSVGILMSEILLAEAQILYS